MAGMSESRRLLSAGLMTSIGVWFLGAGAADAQSIDYDAFELFAGEPATFSATGSPLRASDAPANLEIVTQDTIRASGARDIPSLLRRVPGLQVWSTGAGSAEVAIRGLNQGYSRRILVMVDGRTVFNDAYANIAWSTIPVELNEIRQIEIVRGPNVALFGFNAVAGVINIITYDALQDPTTAVTVRGGEDGYVQGSALLSHVFADRLGVRLSAGVRREDAFDAPVGSNVVVPPEDGESWQVSLRSALRATDRLSLRAEVAGSAATAGEFIFGAEESSTYTRQSALVGFDYELDAFSISGRASYAAIDQEIAAIAQNAQSNPAVDTALDLETDAFNVQLNAFWKPGPDHILRGGLEYRRVSIAQQPVDLGDVSTSVYSASALWNWSATERLSINLAGRVDVLDLGFDGDVSQVLNQEQADFDRSFGEFSANAAVVWRATDSDTFRVIFGRGAVLPSLLEFGAFVAPVEVDTGPPAGVVQGLALIGDPDTDVARTHSIQAVYDRALRPISAEFSLSVFHRWDDIFLSPVEGVIADPGLDGDPGDFRTVGLEARVAGDLPWDLRYDVNYAFADADSDLTDFGRSIEALGFTSTTAANATARHTINLIAGYDGAKISADVSANWVDAYRVTSSRLAALGLAETVRIPSRWRVGARLAYRPTARLELEASVDSVLDDAFPEAPTYEFERRAFLGASYRF